MKNSSLVGITERGEAFTGLVGEIEDQLFRLNQAHKN